MKYYVVCDIHGYYTCLKQALKKAGFFDEKEPHKLIVCGDLLDRGSEANQLIEFLIDLMDNDRLILILGNHEELLVRCLQEIARGGVYEIANGMSHHYLNKTWDSLLQLSKMSEVEAYKNPIELVRRVMNSDFYKRLLPVCVDYYETANYIFTHGWIPCITEGYKPYVKYNYDPNWREADAESWRRARWYNGMEVACKHHVVEPDKTIVCGHWHTSYGHATFGGNSSEWDSDANFSPFYGDGIIALDQCVSHTGFINVIVLNDEELGGENNV